MTNTAAVSLFKSYAPTYVFLTKRYVAPMPVTLVLRPANVAGKNHWL